MQLGFERVSQTLTYVFDNATKGDAKSVLKAFDEMSEKLWIMTIGHAKGSLIVEELSKHNPKIGVELGTYIGYSAVMFGQHFKNRGDGHYYCIEYDPIMAAVATQVIEFAGLSEYVTILRGDLTKNLKVLREQYNIQSTDFFFIDHEKELYIADFDLAESSELISKNTLIIADNIKVPGAPEFLARVVDSKKYSVELKEAELIIMDKWYTDAILISKQL